MVNSQTRLLFKNSLRGMIAATLLLCGMDLSAGERRYATPSSSPASDSSQDPVLRAAPAEDPITSGTPFTWEDVDKVQNGMTEAEVVAILGQPYLRNGSGDDAILVWSYTSSERGSNAVAYRFFKGRVVASHRISR